MHSKQVLISIVIPVYNNALYIRKCVASIVEDEYVHMELILVNDGSTDGSAAICEELALLDKRIRVYHQVNMGVSAARNRGIQEAQGDWLWFIDSDDTIEKNGIQFLVGMLELYPHVSCIGFGLTKIFESSTAVNFTGGYREEIISKWEAMYQLYKPRYFSYFGFVHSKLFKREVMLKHHILFDEGIAFNEDRLFCCQFFDRLEDQVLLVTRSLYNYLMNSNSAIGGLDVQFNPQHITELYALIKMQRIANLSKDKELMFQSRDAVLECIYWQFDVMRRFSIKDDEQTKFLRKTGWLNIKFVDLFNPRIRRRSAGCLRILLKSFFV